MNKSLVVGVVVLGVVVGLCGASSGIQITESRTAWDIVWSGSGVDANSSVPYEIAFSGTTYRVNGQVSADNQGNFKIQQNNLGGPSIWPVEIILRPLLGNTAGYYEVPVSTGPANYSDQSAGQLPVRPAGDPVYEGWSATFVQNTQPHIDTWGETAWLKAGTDYRIALPEHFAFEGMPIVSSTGPGDLTLGTRLLADASRTLIVPIIGNHRADPLAGIRVVGDIWFDGEAAWDTAYGYTFHGHFDITPVGDPGVVLDTGEATGLQVFASSSMFVPEPSGLLALGSGLAGLSGFFYRRRRR